jgi:superfamily II DNA or RNA helicase
MPESHAHDGATVYLPGAPKPGQLVEVRRRRWVTTGVDQSTLSEDDRIRSGGSPQHLVSLSSIEEDALGEELSVVWEIEPGARTIENAGLPTVDGYDDPERLDAFLDAVRWGAGVDADRRAIQAPFRSGVTIEDYQLDPLVRAVDMARVSLLIADDTGLGKTIEAGLVLQELLLRHRARTILVVCPSSLQEKWRVEMQEKFGLEFRIVNSEYVSRLRRERGVRANPWKSFPRLITSMDWAKSGEALRFVKDALPAFPEYPRAFDVLVVDEAHNVAPAGSAKYALESQRTRLIRTISPHFEHRLFLTATPHNGYPESFTSLLELLDEQRFARNVMPEEAERRRVVVRRLKSHIVDADGARVFPIRELETLEVDYTREESEAHRLLREYTRSRQEDPGGEASSLFDGESKSEGSSGGRKSYGEAFTHKLLKKRLFSSPEAFTTTLAKHRETIARGGPRPKRNPLDDRVLRTAILRAEEAYADDDEKEEAEGEAVTIAGRSAASLTATQASLLDRLGTWAEENRNRTDSKARAILSWLEAHIKPHGRWNDERVILFTEYRATHTWLHQILSSQGYGGDRLEILHGGVQGDDRQLVTAAFQADPSDSPVRILLATDAASEGIDLQNHCRYMIHLEIPWNPNVMEQRNGRIDRHGQKHERVHIWHPVGKGFDAEATGDVAVGDAAGDQEFLMRAVKKLDAIRQDLGSVGPVIERQIEEAMLGKRVRLQTGAAEHTAESTRRYVPADRQLEDRIERIHERLMETRKEFHLEPERVVRAVTLAMDLADKPALRSVSLSGAKEGTVFRVPPLPGSWGRAVRGLEHPYTGKPRPITFDHEVAKGRDDVVLAHLHHPLVQMCLHLLRAEVWALDDLKKLRRVTVRSVPADEYDTPIALMWSRLVVTTANRYRVHEELTLSGGWLRENGWARITQVGDLQKIENLIGPLDLGKERLDELFGVLADRFERSGDGVRRTLGARSRERFEILENTLRIRKAREIDDRIAALDDLEKAIVAKLNEEPDDQMQLFSSDESEQLRRDEEALTARLERIPKEREDEPTAIEARYADPTPQTFPVAVVFLIPDGWEGR